MSARNFELFGERKRYGNVTVMHDGKKVDVILHDTTVFSARIGGPVRLNTGGWRTVTTRTAINTALRQWWPGSRCPALVQRKGAWLIEYSDGRMEPFKDGMRVDAGGSK